MPSSGVTSVGEETHADKTRDDFGSSKFSLRGLSGPSLFAAATRVSKPGGDYSCRTLEVRCAIRPSYTS